jgi:hypothetical protein
MVRKEGSGCRRDGPRPSRSFCAKRRSLIARGVLGTLLLRARTDDGQKIWPLGATVTAGLFVVDRWQRGRHFSYNHICTRRVGREELSEWLVELPEPS